MRQILHVSDIHFGPHHAPEVARGVVELTKRRRPDLVVISGDLTQRAKPAQFRAARDFVDRLEAPVLAVPGNHDVPAYRVWERVFAPFGAYRKHFSTELEPSWVDEELLVIGLNTAFNWTHKDGRIDAASLRRVAARLAADDSRRARIVVAHHQLVPAPRYDEQRVVRGAHDAVEVFARHGVEVVLSGHLHQCWITPSEAYYPSGRRPFLIVHTGTTTSTRGRGCERRRNTGNWILIDRREIVISHLEWNLANAHFVCFSRHHFPRLRGEPYALEEV